ncbi:Protein tyrosine phosphatase domain-containing protein 1 [Araneus ventricosus]|uniref:Protein tyrosine phosphatase domain-containing protein 1 n=1 Tax=Araneus ventricosus TaxID=182803 RepID=A0A4Y2SQQ9_ARAVE|nr:Protein tyrosine phosphatase domain-containing protein 1 [Araneus ventricosus]
MSSDPKCNLADLKPVKFSGSQSLALGTLPSVQYGIVQEKLRQSSSKAFHCSVFCPGKRCRYEGAAFWQKEDMPIMGIFSTWITDDIVTMARPSTEIIEKYKIIKQFREFGIKSLINLQERGEHSSCGVPLEKSGFTYDPQIFMENKSKPPFLSFSLFLINNSAFENN